MDVRRGPRSLPGRDPAVQLELRPGAGEDPHLRPGLPGLGHVRGRERDDGRRPAPTGDDLECLHAHRRRRRFRRRRRPGRPPRRPPPRRRRTTPLRSAGPVPRRHHRRPAPAARLSPPRPARLRSGAVRGNGTPLLLDACRRPGDLDRRPGGRAGASVVATRAARALRSRPRRERGFRRASAQGIPAGQRSWAISPRRLAGPHGRPVVDRSRRSRKRTGRRSSSQLGRRASRPRARTSTGPR